MEPDEYELKSCPFCDGDAEMRTVRGTQHYIRCTECGCRTGSSSNAEKAVETWNARADIDIDEAIGLIGGEYLRNLSSE